jgi:hypothetical protein
VMVVGLDRDRLANKPRRHGRGVALKTHGAIGVHLHQGGITAVGSQGR